MLPLLVALGAAFSGCLQSTSSVAEEPGAPVASAPQSWTLYFDADGQLLPDPAAPGGVLLSWSLAQWALGTPPPAWSYPLGPEGLGVLEANAVLTYRARDPATTTAIRDDLTIWWGSSDSTVAHTSVPGPVAYLPGDTVTVEMALEIPRNGLWLGPGEQMRAQVATYTTDGPELDRMELVVGGENGSRLELVAVPFAGTPMAQVEANRWTGSHGGDCTNGAKQFIEHTIEVGAAREFQLRATGTGVQDLDLYILHNDERVMRAHDPGPNEILRLREANVEGLEGDLTLQVLGICAGRFDYTLVALA